MTNTGAAITVQMAAMAGVMSVGVVVETWTGHPFTFWIAAVLGAILIRPLVEGPEATRVDVSSITTGVFLAWLGTDYALARMGIDPQSAKPLIAAAFAGMGEYMIKLVFGKDLFRSIITNLANKYTGGDSNAN